MALYPTFVRRVRTNLRADTEPRSGIDARAIERAALLFANIANLVVAPQLVGFASDALAPRYGPESLRVALIPLALTGFWAAAHYWLAARGLDGALIRAGNEYRPSGQSPTVAAAD